MKKTVLFICLVSVLVSAEEPFTGNINALKADPVYAVSLSKYPKWHAFALLQNGKTIEFISVKSMMQVFFNQAQFKKRKLIDDEIKTLWVKDFINGEKIEASKAVYLFGSRMVGPHGDDLIPFSSESNAKLFMMKNGGTKILPYSKLTQGLIRYLDM